MSATELRDVEALLVQVLPDPRGFAERVVGQLVERLATPGLAGGAVVETYDVQEHDALVDRNVLLAAALGACECWGEDPTCGGCGGKGAAGWVEPDRELFAHYVQPALDRHLRRPPDTGVRPEAPPPAPAGADRPPNGEGR